MFIVNPGHIIDGNIIEASNIFPCVIDFFSNIILIVFLETTSIFIVGTYTIFKFTEVTAAFTFTFIASTIAFLGGFWIFFDTFCNWRHCSTIVWIGFNLCSILNYFENNFFSDLVSSFNLMFLFGTHASNNSISLLISFSRWRHISKITYCFTRQSSCLEVKP